MKICKYNIGGTGFCVLHEQPCHEGPCGDEVLLEGADLSDAVYLRGELVEAARAIAEAIRAVAASISVFCENLPDLFAYALQDEKLAAAMIEAPARLQHFAKSKRKKTRKKNTARILKEYRRRHRNDYQRVRRRLKCSAVSNGRNWLKR